MAPRTITFTETKAFQAFEGSIRSLKQHSQLTDCSLRVANTLINKSDAESIASALCSSVQTHPQLNSPLSKTEVSRIFVASRRKLNEHVILELYRIFSNYMRAIIGELMLADPITLLKNVGENKDNKIEFERIILLGSYDGILHYIADMVYRRLENERSTPKLVEKIINYTKIPVNAGLRDKALMYLEIRHLIIHNNSKADDDFVERADGNIEVSKGTKLPINYHLVSDAINSVQQFCKDFDSKLINGKLVRERFITSL